jgi:hypothetical protein
MKRLTLALVLIALLAGSAWAQTPPRTTHRFAWTQPDTTCNGVPIQDGWLKEYRIWIATPSDTTLVGTVPAPAAVADTAYASLSLQIGLPQAVAVEAVDIWDQVSCVRSEWSDSYIPLPEPPGRGGKPFVLDP